MVEHIQRRSRHAAKISVVTTAWNEEANLRDFHREVRDVLRRDGCENYEIVIVDNGSVDGSLAILKDLADQDPNLRYVSLSRNFGHQGGLIAGMEHARGDVVVTMDADLQHPPATIPSLLEQWENGYEVVSTTRASDHHLPVGRRVLNRIFYKGMATLCAMPFTEQQSDFRLLDRRALDALIALPERSKFLRGLAYWIGFTQTAVSYQPAPRAAGKTKFRFFNLLSFALSGVLSFSVVPLRLMTGAGVTVALLAMLYGLYVIGAAIAGASWPMGWASLAVAVSFLGGLQLIGIGLVGEYVARVLGEVHARPAYIVRERSDA